MKSKFSGILAAMILVTAVVFISGCVPGNVNPEESTVLFKSIPSKGVVVSNIRTYEDAGEVVIRGKVKRTFHNCCDAERGHVDVAVVGPDGLVMDLVNVEHTPRDIPRVGGRTSRFMARLPYTLGEDITLRITYHENSKVSSSSTNARDTLLCEQNITSLDEG